MRERERDREGERDHLESDIDANLPMQGPKNSWWSQVMSIWKQHVEQGAQSICTVPPVTKGSFSHCEKDQRGGRQVL